MGAITIALDITIVGALALPWVLLALHLFVPNAETHLPAMVKWMADLKQPTVVAVVLFAATYFVGSAVSRTAQDFFNDDDLHLSDVDLKSRLSRRVVLRAGVTEDRILAKVYCKNESLLPAEAGEPLASEIRGLKEHNHMCYQAMRSLALFQAGQEEEHDEALTTHAAHVFGLQESALLLKGEDATARLRQFHDQIMVLRGAAFNGVIAVSLCLFAWCSATRRDRIQGKASPAAARLAAIVPWIYLLMALVAGFHHVTDSGSDPPFMEFLLIVLGVSGIMLCRKATRAPRGKPAAPEKTSSVAGETIEPIESPGATPKVKCPDRKTWAALTVLSALLTGVAILGWWSTEVLYAQQVIYSYNYLAPGTQSK